MSPSQACAANSLLLSGDAGETLANAEHWCGKGSTAGNFSVQVATSLQAVEALQPHWKLWADSPETDLDCYLHRLKTDPTILQPYVMTVFENGIPQGMLVGQIVKRRLSTTVFFVNIRGPEATVLEVLRGGRMGLESCPIDKLLALHLFHATKSAGIDLLLLQRFPLQSGLFRELQQLPDLAIKPQVPHTFCYSALPLTAALGRRAPVFSGKNRRETRRKLRILERAFPDKVAFKCFSAPGESDIGMRDAAKVAVTSWQYFLGQDSLNTEQTKNNLGFLASRGWLRVYVMYISRTPCAFLIGQTYKNTFYCQHAGYNPEFARFSVGSLLTSWALDNLLSAGVQQVDLGEGRQEHNRRLGCRIQEEGGVHVYPPTWRGLQLGLFFAAAQMVRSVGRWTVTELRLDRLSSTWSKFRIWRWKTRNGMGDISYEQRICDKG